MPSFLSKVFGRKKDEKEAPQGQGRVSDVSMLEGNFETLSPSATKFPEAPNGKRPGKDKEKDKIPGLALFRVKSNQAAPERPEKRVEVPQLSLRLPSQRDVFQSESDDQKSVADSVIRDRRLNPAETLSLVRACSQAITARGALFTISVSYALKTQFGFIRPRNPRRYAPTLVFCFSGHSAAAHFALHSIFGSQKRRIHAHSNRFSFCICFRI
jgi:hypothetical protein